MPTLFRDYETFSTLDIKKFGAWRYATHPTTGVWCCAYAIDDGPVQLWVPGNPVPAEWIEAAGNPDWLVSAFNDNFERLIEQHTMGPRCGWHYRRSLDARSNCALKEPITLPPSY